MKQEIVCIAGAHRSGTSMVTRLLHRCGLYLGLERDLMPPAADNPDGFWEHLCFVRLNDEILNTAGAAWDLPPRNNQDFNGELLQTQRIKAELLIDDFVDQPIWGWKDPRNSLTLPFWQKLLPGLKTVVILRHPLEVAYSMHKRNGTSYALGLRLWEIYNRRLLTHNKSNQFLFTHYSTFFDDPSTELRRIASFVGLEDSESLAAAVALVKVDRRHTAFTIEQLIDAGVAEPILSLYKTLLELANNGDLAKARKPRAADLDPDVLSGTGNRLSMMVPDSEDTRQELATRRGDEIQYRAEIAQHKRTIEHLRQELAAKSIQAAAEVNRRDGRIEELQKAYTHLDKLLGDERVQRNDLFDQLEKVRRSHEVARLETETARQELAQVSQERTKVSQELTQARSRFLQTNELLQKLSIRLNQFEMRTVSLSDRLRKQLLETKRLTRLLDQIDNAAVLLRSSRRWKLANPFSAIAAIVARKPLPGFGHLDKNVEKYRLWRTNHPEIDTIAEEIQSLRQYEDTVSPPKEKKTTIPLDSAYRPPPPQLPLSFPAHDDVKVTIVIPVYNQVDFTLACLASIQQHSDEIPYEIVVVDDSSTDATSETINSIPGVVYLRNEGNAGFITSCNRGAETARGQYLLFLNNDTIVTSGWLKSLLQTFDLEPQAGLVGSKLVYPDGRLQEAGGIIWRDGTGWNRGKFQDPKEPKYNYLREVDYCSAASIMIPKALFQDLGGFDPKYAPAYYEDTDLAFKVAQSGRKVLYQPLSVVNHYEGITGGTDLSTGTKKHQGINRATFQATWAERLASKPVNGDVVAWESPMEGKRRILVIDHHLPMADRDSGSLRMSHILKVLHQLDHHVTFLPDNLADISPYGDNLRKCGITVLHHPYVSSIREYLRSHGCDFDVIVLSRCDFAQKHIANARLYAPQARLIFDTVDLHFLREQRQAETTGDRELREEAVQRQQLEYDLIDQADETWVVSPAEQALLCAARPDKSIQVVSNIVEVPGSATPFADRHDILFIGSFLHPPNIDGVLFFAQQIFPLIQKRLSSLNFYIIGDKAPPEIMALASDRVIVTGFQPDVRSYFDTIKASVAPLRYGAGVKGKINQSMAFGVPVVATSNAAEGMGLASGENIIIRDGPAEFADALIEVYLSEQLWNKLSRNGLKTTRELYSLDSAARQLTRLLAPLNSPGVLAQSLDHVELQLQKL